MSAPTIDSVDRTGPDPHRVRDLDALRYERKAFVHGLSVREVELAVKRHPSFFREIYHERTINNIYFDSVDFRAYEQNIEGDSERQKIRVRWYGDLVGPIERGTLEFKIKSNVLGLKKQYPVAPFDFSPGCETRTIRAAIESSPLPASARLAVEQQEPKMVNRYSRRYFASLCGRFRITIDSDLEFYRADGLRCSLLHKEVDRETIIVEVKYRRDDDRDAGLVTSLLPFPLTKSSKYVYGVQLLWGFQ